MYQFEVVVCLDDVTVWATVAHELRSIGLLPPSGPVPWVLSLTDLMAVVDLLDGPQLAHYLMRRQRLERDGRVEAHDELDWVGHYVSEGLYFDPHFEGDNPPALFRLLSYTEHIDAWYFSRAGARTVETPKPEQPIPPGVAALLGRLGGQRPEHWITAAVALLDFGDEGREQWDQFIQHVSTHVPQRGWSNASMVAHENLGLTVYVDVRQTPGKLRSFLVGYCKEKAESLNEPNWVAIGEASSGGLFVLLEQRDPARTLADVFQTPAGILPEAASEQSLAPDDEKGQAAHTAEGEVTPDGAS